MHALSPPTLSTPPSKRRKTINSEEIENLTTKMQSKSNIFKGLVVLVRGKLSQPQSSIKKLVLDNGGIVASVVCVKINAIISNQEYINLNKTETVRQACVAQIPFVSEKWLIASLQKKKPLNFDQFQLICPKSSEYTKWKGLPPVSGLAALFRLKPLTDFSHSVFYFSPQGLDLSFCQIESLIHKHGGKAFSSESAMKRYKSKNTELHRIIVNRTNIGDFFQKYFNVRQIDILNKL